MHLVFPNGEHDKVALTKGTYTIGAGEGCDITLASEGLPDNHAMIAVDHRGITLLADSNAVPLTVNGRSVNAKSILRLGDHLSVNGISMVLTGDPGRLNDLGSSDGSLAPANREQPPRILIRGLQGPLSGQAIALFDRVSLGKTGSADQRDILLDDGIHGDIQIEPSGIFLRNASGIEVNGHELTDGQLRPGDQIAAGSHRFLLEAPGFVPGKAYSGVAEGATGSGNTQVFSSPVIEPVAEEPSAEPEETQPPEPDTRGRDTLIVTVCLILSTAMVGWLIMKYLSS